MLKILIVEDEFLISVMLQRKLQSQGYAACDIVGTGKAAIEYVLSNCPDFILMDINLPGSMDGIEAAMKIKELASIPIIFISGYSDKKIISRAETVTPIGYLVKPVSIDQIIKIINQARKKS